MVGALLFTACGEDDEPSLPIAINFSNTEIGLSDEVDITVSFSRPTTVAGSVDISVDAASLKYGEALDYFTEPAAASDIITLPFEVGAESLTLKVKAGNALNIQQDETIKLSLVDEEGFELGSDLSATITVSENFIATDGMIQINGGGASFSNQSYLDLSKLNQTSVDKYSWDLGFYTESGQFYVKLNSSAAVMARPMDVADLNEVSAQDTVGFGYAMSVPPPNFDSSIGSSAWVDSPDGNLETSAFGAISATDGDNKVFIIKRDGEGRSWKKVRVLQNGSGYTLQHADIGSSDFTSVEIAKDASYNFVTFDFEDGLVNVEPPKAEWDIMYSTYTEILSFGPGASIPYLFNDFILLNTGSTSVSMVMIEDTAFEDFSASNIADLEMMTDKDAIGENWRMGGGPGQAPSLHDDRFFVIKDGEGNHYKLKFTQLLDGNNERGNPSFEFELIK